MCASTLESVETLVVDVLAFFWMPETAEAPKSGGDSSVIHDLLIYCWEYVADTPTYPKINLEAQTGIARSIQGCCM